MNICSLDSDNEIQYCCKESLIETAVVITFYVFKRVQHGKYIRGVCTVIPICMILDPL